MAGDITEAAIKGASGQYDLELVQRLRLSNLGLQRLSCLEACAKLRVLDLSRNRLTSLAGLDRCVALKTLSVPFNRLRAVGACAETERISCVFRAARLTTNAWSTF